MINCNPSELYVPINRMHLQIWRWSKDIHIAQLVYLKHWGSWYPTPLTGSYFTGSIRRMLNEEEQQNIKIVDSSVCYIAYTLLISGNMWYDTNVLKIHSIGMATFKNAILAHSFFSVLFSSHHYPSMVGALLFYSLFLSWSITLTRRSYSTVGWVG